jgi:hypothetical protein
MGISELIGHHHYLHYHHHYLHYHHHHRCIIVVSSVCNNMCVKILDEQTAKTSTAKKSDWM